MEIVKNIEHILNRIEKTCAKCGRNPDEVKLLLVTKTVPADRIKIALQAGQTLIAENKVQEIKEKYEILKEIPHEKHFIGHLQTNKIKDILRFDVSCVQSVDRLDLAEKLQQRLEFEDKTIEVFIQVNTSNEKSKFGVHPNQALELIEKVAQLNRLKIKGLMTIGLFSSEEQKVRECFQLLRSIREKIVSLNLQNVIMKELSMGMSGDLEIAIEEGATILRIGTAIFGERSLSDNYYWNENR